MFSTSLAVSLGIGLLQIPSGPPATPALFPEDRYQVFLLTIDQGESLWELFGHNAILIRDHATGEDLAWNWGLFNMQDPEFLPRLIRGTMLYSMGPAPLEPFLAAYRGANRSVYSNEIFLTQEEQRELNRRIVENFQPENRDYVYDYFRDNCSTRVRDLLDAVLGGLLIRRFGEAETPWSYRWQVRRVTQPVWWVNHGLSVLMGLRGDEPRSEWDAMFLPVEMMRLLEDVERPDGEGGTRPLLGPRQVLFQADRPPTPVAAPPFSPLWALGGGTAGALLLLLGWTALRASRRPAMMDLVARGGLAAAIVLWGISSGLLGSLMVLAWFTDHTFAKWNLNVLLTSPLSLALGALMLVAMLRRDWWFGPPGRLAQRLGWLIAAVSVLAALIQLLTPLAQGNLEALAVAIPLNLSAAFALRIATPRGSTT